MQLSLQAKLQTNKQTNSQKRIEKENFDKVTLPLTPWRYDSEIFGKRRTSYSKMQTMMPDKPTIPPHSPQQFRRNTSRSNSNSIITSSSSASNNNSNIGTPIMTPVRSRSRSRGGAGSRRPSLSNNRRNSSKSFISLTVNDGDEEEESGSMRATKFPYISPISPYLQAINSSSSSNNHGALSSGSVIVTSSSMIPPLESLTLPPASSGSSNVNQPVSQHSTVASSINSGPEKFEIPSINATLDHTLPQQYFKSDLLSVVQQLGITKWKKLPAHVANDIQVKRISGALTNAIFRIDAPSIHVLKSVELHHLIFPTLLLRVYGPNVESIIDRESELKILMRLSLRNIGPRLFGCFTNGRVEQYLDNAITLTKSDIMNQRISARIARRMRQLHTGIRLTTRERLEGPVVFKNLKKWSALVSEMGVKDEVKVFGMTFAKFYQVLEKYKAWLQKQYGGEAKMREELVFCHNDTQYGNLLFTTPKSQLQAPFEKDRDLSNENLSSNLSTLSLQDIQTLHPTAIEQTQDQSLVVIDFEYSGANLPEYDIANHFCEWMQNYNHPSKPWAIWESDFPNLEMQLNLIYSYLIYGDMTFVERDNDKSDDKKDKLKKLEECAKRVYDMSIVWRGMVSFNWILWAILQNGQKDDEIKKQQDGADVELVGPNGEVYNIKTATSEDQVSYSDEEAVSDEDEDDQFQNSGEADVDSFDYIKYTQEKVRVFLGDMVQLNIVALADIDDQGIRDTLKYLPCKFYNIEP
ncbi:hypothetical protein WICPIJ_001424 [Wickerhamomyces pijperi]|uniref:Choline kinase N-terminal domain-containing protein n=1 Tax=Wickerhamomyces pijperi TaxID=599730 RepID=A0A9P8QDP8_WICPI|nr:hypothetical protein WICPIJ_001424 [Wickerhamomyces pijperi]